MLGIDRSAARYTWTAAAVLLLLYLIYMLRSTLFVFALALLFAYLLSPLVDILDRAIPRPGTRTLALTLAYVIFLSVVIFIGIHVATEVVAQAGNFVKKLPDMLTKWEEPSPRLPETLNQMKAQLISNVRGDWANGAGNMMKSLPEAGMKFLSVVSHLIYVVIIPVLAFFLLKDGPAIRRHMLELTEGAAMRAVADSVLEDIHLLLAQYMRALVLLSLATFSAYSLFFAIVRLPYGILLASMAMMLEFIPMIGPLAAAVLILIVTLISGGTFWIVLVFLIAYRMFQDYVLAPLLMSQGAALHPLLVLLGVFGGAEVAGVAGSFLSVPVLATARIVYVRTRRSLLAPPTASSGPGTPAKPMPSAVEAPSVVTPTILTP